MTFCIITHVPHGYQNGYYYAYSPYVREMNIWSQHVDKIILVAPLMLNSRNEIDISYSQNNIDFRKISRFDFLSLKSAFLMFIKLPRIIVRIYKAMADSDHIHLRCPGNIGLLGCFVQILFPSKPKTAKYAGNWDPKASQPFTYKLQKWILGNTFLTKNMQVLVYGEWENSSKNIKPFFTASYFEKDKAAIKPRDLKGLITFLFVGTLSNGKQPLYAIQLIEALYTKGHDVQLMIYGEGAERTMLEDYIRNKKLESRITLKGNQNQETIKKGYKESHFLILPSLSEGWPKVVAESMFWACLPIASKVSCVPNMMGKGDRGILLNLKLEEDIKKIETVLSDAVMYQEKATKAMKWSRQFTMDTFENEIKLLLKP